MSDKKHFSKSQLGMLTRCGMQYYYRYIEGLKLAPAVAMIVGRCTHKSVEVNLQSKIDTGCLLSLDNVRAIAADETEAAFQEEILLSPDEKQAGIETVKGESIDRAVMLSTLHAETLAPIIQPAHVEMGWTIIIPNSDYEFVGITDIIETTGVIRDTKTKAKSPTQNDADTDQGLTAYALNQWVNGVETPSLALDALVSTKTPKTVTLTTNRTEADYKRLMRRVENAQMIVEKQAFMPCAEDAWVCSEKWCGYWGICPFGIRGRNKPTN